MREVRHHQIEFERFSIDGNDYSLRRLSIMELNNIDWELGIFISHGYITYKKTLEGMIFHTRPISIDLLSSHISDIGNQIYINNIMKKKIPLTDNSINSIKKYKLYGRM